MERHDLSHAPCTCDMPEHDGKVHTTIIGYVQSIKPLVTVYFIYNDCPEHGMYDESHIRAKAIRDRCTPEFAREMKNHFVTSREHLGKTHPHLLPRHEGVEYLWSDWKLAPSHYDHTHFAGVKTDPDPQEAVRAASIAAYHRGGIVPSGYGLANIKPIQP
jgi:hypothetical protein